MCVVGGEIHYWRVKCRLPLLRCVLLVVKYIKMLLVSFRCSTRNVQNSLLVVVKYIKMLLVSFRCSTRSKMCRILFWWNTLKCCLLVWDVQPEARTRSVSRADEQANQERQPSGRTSEPRATAERTNKRTRSDSRADEQANPERQPSGRTSEQERRLRCSTIIVCVANTFSSVLYKHM